MDIIAQLGLRWPIFQAPMAGVSTPAMAAAVSNAGGLGALGLGAAGVDAARAMIRETRGLTARPFNANFFCHDPARRDAGSEAAWLQALAPEFARFGASPPDRLHEIYTSFVADPAMYDMVLDEKPGVVSLHFGLPDPAWIKGLKEAGNLVLASATSLDEAHAAERAGVDAVVAQGIEAGGHRGMFDPDAPDEALTTDALVTRLVAGIGLPVIAAGGLMTGADVARVMGLGAVAAQLGTAFLDCTESAADAGYRAALRALHSQPPVLTKAISGRPARCLQNRFTEWGAGRDGVPDYPVTYDAGKALHGVAKAQGEHGYGAHWAGTGVARTRHGEAAAILADIATEWRAAGQG
ncbi:NAD(P)H-dependent flavin oxidoreductase [Shimia aestuarii]|uniref:Nitronate monooxygenase n=1 Tax=Shimia aestuarii TaxID=254406 RepID=A0A1I4HFQ8_9RHOB|nr:nitronate monooxygenase [Shimia aestuarii]SFL40533.1 nitronate monooxygenase [Shimia aestuarii]